MIKHCWQSAVPSWECKIVQDLKTVDKNLELAKDICHLPPWGLSPVRCSCRPLTCLKSSGWTTGMRRSVLQENWCTSYFQELILWAQCLHLFISNKSTKSLHGDITSSSLVENILCSKCLTAWTLPSPESHKLTFPHTPPLWSSLSEPSEVPSPGWQSSFCSK